MRSKGRSEAEVLAGVMAYLSLRRDVMFWRANTAALDVAGRFLKFGKKGQADVIVCQAPAGKMIGIECKREIGGTLSADQKRWGEQLQAFGGKYVVARCTADVEKSLGPETVYIVHSDRKRVIHR